MNCSLEELESNKHDDSLTNSPNRQLDNSTNSNNETNESSSRSSTSSSYDQENPLSSLSLAEQIAIFRSKIQQLEIINADLKAELNQFKSEQMNKTGVQSGLKSRICEQNNTILEMKNEKINLQLNNEQLTNEKENLNEQLGQYLMQIGQFKQEMMQKDNVIERLRADICELKKEKEQVKLVKQQVKQVSDTLEIVQEKEVLKQPFGPFLVQKKNKKVLK